MKTIAIASPIIASENMESSVMGIDSVGMDLCTYFMRDKIYSNKIRAVVREYLCNAVDEHVKFDVNQPVQVGLRSENNEVVFYVRDHAKGLDEDGVRNIFGMYFRSTKSKSNDSIGGFGVGSKAGHCYNDTFFVTSYFNGKKSVYTCMLGAGDSGVPVGHIYKVDECETKESGLEVSVPVKYRDYTSFEEEIDFFVCNSPHDIECKIFERETYKPNELVNSIEFDGIKIRLLKTKNESYSSGSIILQMGGVTYGQISIFEFDFKVKAGHELCVDIPIGSMTIPISRESFEETPQNKNVINRIKEIVQELADKDLAQFKVKGTLELLNDLLGGMRNGEYEGNVFSCRTQSLFKDVWSVVGNSHKLFDSDVTKKNGKPILVSIPDNHNSEYWRTKVRNFAKDNNENYFIVCESRFSSKDINPQKINDALTVISAKKIKYPKVKKNNQLFAVYELHGRKIGEMTSFELHNHARAHRGLPLASDENEAREQNEEYFSDLEKCDIESFTISLKSGSHRCYRCNSTSLIKEMKELGWLDFTSAECKELRSKLQKLKEEKYQKNCVINGAKKSWLVFSEKTERRIKEYKNAKRLQDLWDKIDKEDSTRSKIIKSFNSGSYYSCPKYSRVEFRTIMKLK
jgi:hypothetical protein